MPVLYHVLQQPTWASHPFTPRGFPECSAGQGSLAAPLDALEVCGAKRCWAVLSCSSWSGDGHRKTSTRNYSCFFPLLPLLKHFVPGSSQLCRAPSQAGWCMGRGCWSGGMWGCNPFPLQGPSLPCAAPAWAPGEALLLWHGEREGLANRIRSCGTSQQPQALA